MKKDAILAVDIENIDLERAARVAQLAALKEIYLIDARISRDPLVSTPDSLSLEHKCSTEFLDSTDDITHYLCNFQVAAFDSKSPNNLVLRIEASFCTSFIRVHQPTPEYSPPPDNSSQEVPDGSVQESVQDLLEVIEYFQTINPISNAWPYWREFVQSMSARMGFPALTVPLLKIMPKKSLAKEAKSKAVKKESTRRKKLNA